MSTEPIPYFHCYTRILALDAAARAWRGTPFMRGSRVPGAGVDCVQLTAALAIAAGWIDAVDLPTGYPVDWTEHMEGSLIEDWIEQHVCSRVQVLPWDREAVRAGDVVGFRRGGGINHMATMIARGDLLHAIKPLGVQYVHVSALPFLALKYRIEPERIYRPLQLD
jgi:cell wall-associated NlpC family hydrolase